MKAKKIPLSLKSKSDRLDCGLLRFNIDSRS